MGPRFSAKIKTGLIKYINILIYYFVFHLHLPFFTVNNVNKTERKKIPCFFNEKKNDYRNNQRKTKIIGFFS